MDTRGNIPEKSTARRFSDESGREELDQRPHMSQANEMSTEAGNATE